MCPRPGILKLNLDGASRGNLGPAGYGGVIHNDKGDIVHIFSMYLGEAKNNEAKFSALEHGLRILIRMGNGTAVVEGDSLLAISAAKKIQNGTKAEKVSKHWHLAMVTGLIAQHLNSLTGVVLHAIRRKANTLVDALANHAVDHLNDAIDICWNEVTFPNLRDEFLCISRSDLSGVPVMENNLQSTDIL